MKQEMAKTTHATKLCRDRVCGFTSNPDSVLFTQTQLGKFRRLSTLVVMLQTLYFQFAGIKIFKTRILDRLDAG